MKLKQTGLVFLSLLFCLNACTFFPAPQPGQPTGPGAPLFIKAEKRFQQKSYNEALALFNQYLSSFSSQPPAPKALMRIGEIYRMRKEYPQARKAYRQVINRYGQSKYIGQAMSWILQTYHDEGAHREVLRYAKGFLHKAPTRADAAGMYLIVGDAYMALNSPVDAVYFYAKANEAAAFSRENYIAPRLQAAIQQLSRPEIGALLERVTQGGVRGSLMHQMGKLEISHGRYADGMRTLSQFVAVMPNHPEAPEARQMLDELRLHHSVESMGQEVVLGCLLPLTGSYQVYGNRALKGAKMAAAQAGKGVQLAIKDTGSKDETASQAVAALASENAIGIIGPIITASASAETAQQMGIPIVVLSQKQGIPDVGPYVFRHFLTPRMQARALAAYAVDRMHLSQFSVLYPDEKYGSTFMNLFWSEVMAKGGNLLGAESYSTSQTDFTVPIRKLKKHGRFDALFIPDAPKKTGLIIPQLVYYGVSGVQLLGTNLWHSEKLVRTAGQYADGALFPDVFLDSSQSPEVQAFVGEFEKNYGEKPGFIEALAYDTTQMLIQLARQPDVQTAEDLRAALAYMRPYRGVTGLTSFAENGETQKDLYLIKIVKDKFVEVSPGW